MPTGPGILDIGQGFAQGWVSALTDIDTVARDQLGAIRRALNGFYKYVQFGATRAGNVTAALAAGDVVCYVVGTTADLDRLTLADSPNSAVGAGVVMAPIPNTGGPYFGWIMVCGTCQLNNALGGSAAAGNEVTSTGATAKTLTTKAAVTNISAGVAIDVSVAASPIVNINFPF